MSKLMSALELCGEWLKAFEPELTVDMLNACPSDHIFECHRCGADTTPRGFSCECKVTVRPGDFYIQAVDAWLENQRDTGWDESLELLVLDVLDQADNPELAGAVESLKLALTKGDDVEIESLCDDLSVCNPFGGE